MSILFIWSFVSAYTTQQQLEWYEWAYENWITTQTLDNARLNSYITRQALAKMIVTFSNMIWLKEKNNICNYSDYGKITEDLKTYATKACKLWLMWVNTNLFSPMNNVTKAQFSSILSRIIWWNKYDGWNPYYIRHLNALKTAWIIDNINNPSSYEKRGDIMYMLKKAYNAVESISNNENSNIIQKTTNNTNKNLDSINTNNSVVEVNHVDKLEIYSLTHPLREARVGEAVRLSLNYMSDPTEISWDFWDWTENISCVWPICSEVTRSWKKSWNYLIKVHVEFGNREVADQTMKFKILDENQVGILEIYSPSHPLQVAKLGDSVQLSLKSSWTLKKIVWNFWDWTQTTECSGRSCLEVTRSWTKAWTYLIKVYAEFDDHESVEQTMQLKIVDMNQVDKVDSQIDKVEIYSSSHPLQEAKVWEAVHLSLNYMSDPTAISWDFWDWTEDISCVWPICSQVTRSWKKSWIYLIKVQVKFQHGEVVDKTMKFKII